MNGWAAIAAAAVAPLERLTAACADPAARQSAWLLDLVARNADTAFGRRHCFAGVRSIEDYRERVPVSPYERLADDIRAIADGARGVLTADPVLAFEETSGSTGGRKLIPYTKAGLTDIEDAVLCWLHRLAAVHPGVTAGVAYWSVSPVGRMPARTRSGVPIGFTSDRDYFSDSAASALSLLAAVPLEFGHIEDVDIWRFLTLRTLLSRDDLTFISVWSPTFLSMLLDAVPALADRLLAAIHDGVPGCDGPMALRSAFRPQPERARLLARAIDPIEVSRVWPRLAVVSAWSHGPARGAFEALRNRMPQVALDGKGLMATEGIVSLSLADRRYPVPALASTFVEFLDADGRARLAHELDEGASYRTVITTRSGLYRYDLGDEVICRHIEAGIAELEFAGRAGVVADMVGEKLGEAFVAACITDIEGDALLAPLHAADRHYILLHDATTSPPGLTGEIERRLASNPHYYYARRIGQLGPLRTRACKGLRSTYHRWRLAQGQRLGDIKPPALLRTAEETAALLAFLPGASDAAPAVRLDGWRPV
jgi:hypothetical protein